MDLTSPDHDDGRSHRPLMYAWLVLAACCVGYLVTRYLLDGVGPLVLSQVFFLLPVIAGTVAITLAAKRTPSGSRARLGWSLLSLALMLLTASELLYGYVAIAGRQGLADVYVAADALNALACMVFVSLLAFVSWFERIGRLTMVRLSLDVVSLGCLVFAVLFKFSVASTVATGAGQDPWRAVQYAAYESAGMLILLGIATIASIVSVPAGQWQPTYKLLALGLSIFGIGVVLWPAWETASRGLLENPTVEAIATVSLLVGYGLIGMAGLHALFGRSDPWGQLYVPLRRVVWRNFVVSSVVFGSLVVLGWWTIEAPRASFEESAYLTILGVAAVSTVLRTSVDTLSSRRLQTAAKTDAVTGIPNVHALRSCIERMTAEACSADRPFALAVVDIDGFTAINAEKGREYGDRVLTSVASALSDAATSVGGVYRIFGDEFGVVLTDVQLERRHGAIEALSQAVRFATGTGELTASIGVVCCPEHGRNADEVITFATAACTWAKRQGGSRIALFDDRLEAALAIESRMSGPSDNPRLDMARALLASADVRDASHYRHSRNVAALAVLLATELGFDAERLERLQIAAMLHDVGKIALPDTMLGNRPVAIRQRRAEQEHAALGGKLLESLQLEDVSVWVRAHHERWDGAGYPDGLGGEQIPLEARIIALADAYDGMTTGKRYGAPMSKGAALQEIDLGIGARFEPALAERFIRVVGCTSALGWSDRWPAA